VHLQIFIALDVVVKNRCTTRTQRGTKKHDDERIEGLQTLGTKEEASRAHHENHGQDPRLRQTDVGRDLLVFCIK
jgi:hypothetical protein